MMKTILQKGMCALLTAALLVGIVPMSVQAEVQKQDDKNFITTGNVQEAAISEADEKVIAKSLGFSDDYDPDGYIRVVKSKDASVSIDWENASFAKEDVLFSQVVGMKLGRTKDGTLTADTVDLGVLYNTQNPNVTHWFADGNRSYQMRERVLHKNEYSNLYKTNKLHAGFLSCTDNGFFTEDTIPTLKTEYEAFDLGRYVYDWKNALFTDNKGSYPGYESLAMSAFEVENTDGSCYSVGIELDLCYFDKNFEQIELSKAQEFDRVYDFDLICVILSLGDHAYALPYMPEYKYNTSVLFNDLSVSAPKATSISKLTAKSKGFKVSVKKQTKNTTGYQIQYSTTKKFSKAKTVTINTSSNTNTAETITQLKANTKYYVRVRSYKIDGNSEGIPNFRYSKWSAVKSVKTKK